ncbi:MAG: tetratricopeptide repeat protein [Chitinophagaceae bacterium]|nr:MAG: tetratricopeptide repeat protein [Chitinophagaceae bacterium]
MKNLLLAAALLLSLNSIAGNSDSSTYYFNKGIQEKNNKRWLVANQAFEKSISLDPRYAEAYLENAAVLLEMRKTDKAKENFLRLYEIQPGNKTAIKELASLYFSYRQYDKAIEFAKKCSDCSDANRIIGMSYYQQEDYAAAEKALQLALKQNPADAEATYTLARNYLDMEAYKQAVPWYEKAIAMEGAKNTWMYELALLYYNNNDYKNAVVAFNKAAAGGYEQKNDFNENLGYASLYAGDYDKGEELLLGILKRKPNNTTLMRDMAEIFYQQKQYDRSLGYCQKLMELDPKDGKALYQAGLCFQKKGQKDRGQQMCDKAIEIDPSLDKLRKKKEMPGGGI